MKDAVGASPDVAYLYAKGHGCDDPVVRRHAERLGDASRERRAEVEAVLLVAERDGAGVAARTDGVHDDLQRLKTAFDLLLRALRVQHSRGRSLGRTSPALRLCMGTARAGRALAGPPQRMTRACPRLGSAVRAQCGRCRSGEGMRIARVLGCFRGVLLW
jgi:hypothetical protein